MATAIETVETYTSEEMPAEVYHAHPAIGASMLEDFRHSRRYFHGRYVAKTIPPREPSDAMTLGTLIHARLLEPAKYPELLAPPAPELAPDGKNWLRRKGSDHERWWAEYEESCAGKIIADRETLATVEAVAASVLSRRHARRLLEGKGEPEFSIFWTDPETGLRCKCRVDWFCSVPLDLKTTKDASPMAYAADCAKYGYHRKRAHYVDGMFALTGEKQPFAHIAACTSNPYEVGVYDLDDTDARSGRSLGVDQHRDTLRALAECMESNVWDNPWESQITRLALPARAFTEDAYQFGE